MSLASALVVGGIVYLATRDNHPHVESPQVIVIKQFELDGVLRQYRMATTETPNRSVTLVIALHGSTVDGMLIMPVYSNLDSWANDSTIIVYPNAIDQKWDLAGDSDIRFFDAIRAHVSAGHTINRIFVAGMSRGGKMASYIASKREVHGLALHSTSLGDLTEINAKRKCKVYIAHGTDDILIPVTDGHILRDQYQREGHIVKYVELPGWGHFWYGGIEYDMWDFLK